MKSNKFLTNVSLLVTILWFVSCTNSNNVESLDRDSKQQKPTLSIYVPDGYYYTSTHEWVKVLPDSSIQIGLTEFGVNNAGTISDVIVYGHDPTPTVEYPSKPPRKVATIVGNISNVDLLVPIEGYMKNFNSLVLNSPNLINVAPYDNWVYSMDRFNYSHLTDSLMSASQYRSYIGQ